MLSKVAAKNSGTCCSNGLGLVNNCPTCGPICQNNTATSSQGKLPFCSYNLFWSTHVSVLPQTHPNPPASFTISFTWGFLLNAKNRCLATKYSPLQKSARLLFLSKFHISERKEKEREREISLWCEVYKSQLCTSSGMLFKRNVQPSVTSTELKTAADTPRVFQGRIRKVLKKNKSLIPT